MVYNLKFISQKGHLVCCNPTVINNGSVLIADAEFLLDSSWDGYSVTATFVADETQITVALDSKRRCTVPWEVLQLAGKSLRVGVVGTLGSKVYPSDYADLGVIGVGCQKGEFGESEPTPDMYTQMLGLVNDSFEAAEQAKKAAEDAEEAVKFAAQIIRDETGRPYRLGIEQGILYIEGV
ncbi:MAG: hypothetical protein IKU89_04785 [Oscillospiraceae bacterium]|nr:hypothetical protein [Oscillospiraceae bacterium]